MLDVSSKAVLEKDRARPSAGRFCVLVTSSDRARDVFEIVFQNAQTIWRDCNWPRFVGFTSKHPDLYGFTTLAAKGPSHWRQEVGDYLDALPNEIEYVLRIDEDALFMSPVDGDKLNAIADLMVRENLSYVSLLPVYRNLPGRIIEYFRRKLHNSPLRPSAAQAPIHGHPRLAAQDFGGDGPALVAWTRYLAALRTYHRHDLRLPTLSEHRTMLDRLSGSLFQLVPFLSPPQFEAIRGLGVLDQFFNNLRDLAEDAAHRICYFPDDVLARAGLRRDDVLGDGWRSTPSWPKLMRFWLDEYLPDLERGAARFDACDDLHPSVARLRSECRARYLRILHRFRAVRFDFRRFAEEYWREVRASAGAKPSR